MKNLLLLLLILSFTSCENIIGVTETEVDAVQQVLNFYDGKCHRKKGFTAGTNGNAKSFVLEMQESDLLEQNYELRNYHSANIAYIFYSNLKNEKENYDFIETKIIYNNGKEFKAKYSRKTLVEIVKLMPIINEISKLLMNSEYEKLNNYADKSVSFEINKNNTFELLDNKYGKITLVQFQGFETVIGKKYGELIVFNTVTVRDSVILPMKVIIKRDNGKLVSIELEY